ncbi:hypothetical protein SAMN06296386_104144 [Lachnospiraceae bacterium]|nr:hypothetical protein SAMN06296386_104144 [Lachnospiraceae bacterium]
MEIYEYGNKSADIVLIQPVEEHYLEKIEGEIEEIKARTDRDFMLAAFKVNDWNKDLSPWKAPAVFGKDDFGDGAQGTLDEIVKYCQDKSKTYFIGGYSLAGLFSLWAVHQTDLFTGAAAVSPSVWFPNFYDYLKENEIKCGNVYLSLGDREENAKNPVLASVGDKIRSTEMLLREQKVNSILEWNEGNHFRDADIRTAKGFSWIIGTNN